MVATAEQREQSNVMRLAAMLPGATAGGMDALRGGSIVPFSSVAADIGNSIHGEAPGFVISRDAAQKMFEKAGVLALLNSGHFRTMRGSPFLAVFAPVGAVRQELIVPWAIVPPAAQTRMPWEAG
jgi:hypothetical protein